MSLSRHVQGYSQQDVDQQISVTLLLLSEHAQWGQQHSQNDFADITCSQGFEIWVPQPGQ